MNKAFLIGNLTADPVTRTTQTGKTVCQFTIAVNRRDKGETDFFRVSAWGQLGETCNKWLVKGRKVNVIGSVSATAYIAQDGKARASMDVLAQEVEFLTPASQGQQNAPQAAKTDTQSGFVDVTGEQLPF